jgi:hypothetical protein
MTTLNEINQTKSEIKKYKGMLTDPGCKFEERTWIELQLIELRKWLKIQNKE